MNEKETRSLKIRKCFSETRQFFRRGAGKKLLLLLEALLAVAFLLQPQLYYDGTAPTFFGRFYADSITICGGLWVILVFLTIKEFHISER